MPQKIDVKRLHVVDALRGFAIVSIMLLHNIEHFDFYYIPKGLPQWMGALDQGIWDTLFFLFGGKSYAIFALLFGLTFHIQTSHQKERGKNFDGRFAWRMVLLLGFGIVNSAFFQGDILAIYAALGFLLIPLGKLGNKAMFTIACILLLLPLEWIHLVQAIQHPAMHIDDPLSWSYFGKMGKYIKEDSFLNTIIGNLSNGKMAVLLWNKENGRFFLILSYFLFGILAGRKNLFVLSTSHQSFWLKALLIATLIFVPLYWIKSHFHTWIDSDAIRRSSSLLLNTASNTAFMVILVSGFTLLFKLKYTKKALNYLSPIGKMSLSNYILQSVLGATIYYGFGFGMYEHTGASYSLIIGVGLSIFLGVFCTIWAKHHKRGPLEGIWHRLTWITPYKDNRITQGINRRN